MYKSPTPFLKAIAKAYKERYSDLSDFLFVFPNKRSGTFFINHLCNLYGDKPFLAPQTLTLTELGLEITGKVADSRIDMLFQLYNSYLAVARESEETEPVDFDSFRGWGDVVLQDFNLVDSYGVNAEELFKNVKDLKEIQSNFLTEEQLEVMQEYFGEVDRKKAYDSFWNVFHYQAPYQHTHQTKTCERFLNLWEVLAPMYEHFNNALAEKGLTYPGRAMRDALKIVKETEGATLQPTKIVFIGFSLLTTVDIALFKEMKSLERDDSPEPYADFIWDFTGPATCDERNESISFMRSHMKLFPMPEWIAPYFESSMVEELPPNLQIIASPSNAEQVKIASTIAKSLHEKIGDEPFMKASVGVVLPDENLLLPMLYSLPADVGDANLTMGYPLRLTSTISFVAILRRLQTRKRKTSKGGWEFFHQDVDKLLAHPFAHIILGSENIFSIRKSLKTKKLYTYPFELLSSLDENLRPLLTPITSDMGSNEPIDYLDKALGMVYDKLEGEKVTKSGMLKGKLDMDNITSYRDALRRLRDAIEEHHIEMNPSTVFSLSDRMIGGETVPFEGEPVQGLQIVGLLETRCLDFRHLIITSMNERIFPKRMRQRSFIPANMKVAYGMPTNQVMEKTYAYYFYRMICRAENVYFIYDARLQDMHTGDISRYLLQLQYLYAKNQLDVKNYYFSVNSPKTYPQQALKSASVMEVLGKFCIEGSGYNLSNSSIFKYLECPLKFFFSAVKRINDDAQPQEYMDPITQGQIIHNAIMKVYLPKDLRRQYLPSPVTLTADRIDSLLADEESLRTLIVSEVKKEYLHQDINDTTPLYGEAALMADMLLDQLKMILKRDRKQTPINLYGCEVKKTFKWVMNDGRCLNMTASIDRIDQVWVKGAPCMRIVDYKTGAVHMECDSVESIFEGGYTSKISFQLLLYANIFNRAISHGNTPLILSIYDVTKMAKDDKSIVSPKISKITLKTQFDEIAGETVNDVFLKHLDKKLTEMFSPDIPFSSCEDTSHCSMCAYHTLCNR